MLAKYAFIQKYSKNNKNSFKWLENVKEDQLMKKIYIKCNIIHAFYSYFK